MRRRCEPFGSHSKRQTTVCSTVTNGKKLEQEGPFAGFWVRVSRALRKAGYRNRDQVRADIESGALRPFGSVRDYGKYADRDTRRLLGLKTWEEQWGTGTSSMSNPPARSVIRRRHRNR
jgi:hypothetical protein